MKLIQTGVVLSLLMLLARESHAAAITTRSDACFSDPSTYCDTSGNRTGRGATSSISRAIDYIDPASDRGLHVTSGAGTYIRDYDHFSLNAYSTSQISWKDPLGFVSYGYGRATATYQDTITATGSTGAGTLVMLWQVEGANRIVVAGSNSPVDVGASVSLDFTCSSSVRTGGRVYDCGRGGPFPNDPGYRPWLLATSSGGVSSVAALDFPIVFGQPVTTYVFVDLIARLGISSGSCSVAGCIAALDGAVEGNYGSTGTLVGIQVLDAGRNPLSTFSLQSESGFRYDLVGAPVTSPVPEPMTVTLSLAGLLVLLLRKRRSAMLS